MPEPIERPSGEIEGRVGGREEEKKATKKNRLCLRARLLRTLVPFSTS